MICGRFASPFKRRAAARRRVAGVCAGFPRVFALRRHPAKVGEVRWRAGPRPGPIWWLCVSARLARAAAKGLRGVGQRAFSAPWTVIRTRALISAHRRGSSLRRPAGEDGPTPSPGPAVFQAPRGQSRPFASPPPHRAGTKRPPPATGTGVSMGEGAAVRCKEGIRRAGTGLGLHEIKDLPSDKFAHPRDPESGARRQHGDERCLVASLAGNEKREGREALPSHERRSGGVTD